MKLADHLLLGLPFGLILYLGLLGGGFDTIVAGRAGVLIWWLLLLGALAAMLSVSASRGAMPDRLGRDGLLICGLLAAFAVWTGLSMIWSESAGRSAVELARASTYLAVLLAALLLRSRLGMRAMLGSLAAGLGAIALVAVLSRLQPGPFPDNETTELVGAAVARLNYPVNSWNGLAGLLALALPLYVYLGAHARATAVRALATAILPLLGLGMFWTLSRGGVLAAALGLATLVALHPRRRRLLAPLGAGALGSAILIAAADARSELSDGLAGAEALSQGDELSLIAIAVCGLAALAPILARKVAVRRLASGRRARWSPPALGGRARIGALGAVLATLVVLALALGARGEVEQRWQEFKDPGIARDSERLESASGNGRYQWWDAALEANASAPILGIGAGSFEFWWSRNGSIPSRIADAHSLYLEALGELGVPGLLLIVALIGSALTLIVRRARAVPPPARAGLAACAGAGASFALVAGTDWSWELPVLPVAFLIAVAAALGGRGEPERPLPTWVRRRPRALLAAVSVLGLVAIVPPLLGADAIRASQEQVAAGELDAALDDAERAEAIEPYSGAAALQVALVLELRGELDAASDAARAATRREPTNWVNWLTLSRLEVERVEAGERERAADAVAAYERARELNPSSALFAQDLPRPGEPAQGSGDLRIGFVGDQFGGDLLTSLDPELRALWWDRLAATNSDVVRINLYWNQIAGAEAPAEPSDPADPSYDWAIPDAAVREAGARDLEVVFTVVGAPRWAEGPDPPPEDSYRVGSWKPDAERFGEFARAAARRYSGGFEGLPQVRYWEAWNEPNIPQYISPQWGGSDGEQPRSPAIYRRLLNSFYEGVKEVDPENIVIAAGTSPFGDEPGETRMRPYLFWRELLCLEGQQEPTARAGAACASGEARAHLDIYAHHPINAIPGEGPRTEPEHPDDGVPANFAELRRIVAAAEEQETILPAGSERPGWATELWYESNPPERKAVSLKKQARFMQEALYLLWQQGADAAFFLQLRDAPYDPELPALVGFQTGVYLPDDEPKPSLDGVRFPFVAERRSPDEVAVWGKAPRSGRLTVTESGELGSRRLLRFRVERGEVFERVTELDEGLAQTLRAEVGGRRSLRWKLE